MKMGKTKIDQALEALNTGNGVLAQTVKDRDGSSYYATVYGNVGDGWDHFLNIFIDSDSFGTIMFAAFKGKLSSPEENGITPSKKRQITIDTTDAPETCILRIDEEGFSLDQYVRDPLKSCSDPVPRKNSWKWVDFKKSDGSIAFTRNQLVEDKDLSLAVILNKLSDHLWAEGYADKLHTLEKYSRAGVLVRAESEDSIEASIVQDNDRPDLPCKIFMGDTITCRPYIDEKIDISATTSDRSNLDKVNPVVTETSNIKETSKKLGKNSSELSQSTSGVDEKKNITTILSDYESKYNSYRKEWEFYFGSENSKLSTITYTSKSEVKNEAKAILSEQKRYGGIFENLIMDVDGAIEPLISERTDAETIKKAILLIEKVLGAITDWTITFDFSAAKDISVSNSTYHVNSYVLSILNKWQRRYNSFPEIALKRALKSIDQRIKNATQTVEKKTEESKSLERKGKELQEKISNISTIIEQDQKNLNTNILKAEERFSGAINKEKQQIHELHKRISEIITKITEDKADLNGLSVFKFKRKKELTEEIPSLEIQLETLKQDEAKHNDTLRKIERDKEAEINKIKDSISKKKDEVNKYKEELSDNSRERNDLREIISSSQKEIDECQSLRGRIGEIPIDELNERFPYEENHGSLAHKDTLSGKVRKIKFDPRANMSKGELEREKIKDEILLILAGESEGLTATEVSKMCNQPVQKTSALIRQLEAEGKVRKIYLKKVAYFVLSD